RRSYHHRGLRQALVEAALAALPEVGAERLSLRALARRAGVSEAAPYHHFADKDALLGAVAAECALLLLAALEAAVAEAGGDQRARFQLTGVAYVRFAVAHPAHFRALELPGVAARLPADVRRRVDAFYREEERRMRAAQAAGLFAPLPFDDLILAATSLVHGLAHLMIDGATPVKRGDVAQAAKLARAVTAVMGAGLLPRARSS
ncbi:MAG TPA: TetR/AcrR family transcriptional regulator, partial [Polyangia bacterium]|nr:TetR/AcrR family transcriptional regulator [Polyangia bacterium]